MVKVSMYGKCGWKSHLLQKKRLPLVNFYSLKMTKKNLKNKKPCYTCYSLFWCAQTTNTSKIRINCYIYVNSGRLGYCTFWLWCGEKNLPCTVDASLLTHYVHQYMRLTMLWHSAQQTWCSFHIRNTPSLKSCWASVGRAMISGMQHDALVSWCQPLIRT
jgi:hypothetical protein